MCGCVFRLLSDAAQALEKKLFFHSNSHDQNKENKNPNESEIQNHKHKATKKRKEPHDLPIFNGSLVKHTKTDL
jgi:hypothetical protein